MFWKSKVNKIICNDFGWEKFDVNEDMIIKCLFKIFYINRSLMFKIVVGNFGRFDIL